MKLLLFTALLASVALQASAANISFRGTATRDDSVQLFTFNLTASSAVTVRTYSYAGGTNSGGAAIPEGGFDPYVSLFDSTGLLIAENDDAPGVPSSPVTFSAYDAFLTQTLAAGSYTLALTQFDNFATGPNLAAGFIEAGNATFTSIFGCSNRSFCDIDGNNRGNAWAIDFLNVASATGPGGPPSAVPEPSSAVLVLGGVSWGAYTWLRRNRAGSR